MRMPWVLSQTRKVDPTARWWPRASVILGRRHFQKEQTDEKRLYHPYRRLSPRLGLGRRPPVGTWHGGGLEGGPVSLTFREDGTATMEARIALTEEGLFADLFGEVLSSWRTSRPT